MSKYAAFVKETLLNLISDLDSNKKDYLRNPTVDFSRNRKVSFESTMKFILSIGGGTLSKEILDHFQYGLTTITASAFVQQRQKILPEAFSALHQKLNEAFPVKKKFQDYMLLACDGSKINFPGNSIGNDKIDNAYHLNAFFNLLEKRYMDVLVQPIHKKNEYQAFSELVDCSLIKGNVIIMADRGYESYNLFAHTEKKGWNYLIRCKDVHSNGIISKLSCPKENEFDADYHLILTKKNTADVKKNPELFRRIHKNNSFDFLDLKENLYYPMDLRVVRFKISPNKYECIITNLDREKFPPETIKKLYHLRWGIETAFRELKYDIGLTNFHSKNAASIMQEIYARIVMYNYCTLITTHVHIKQSSTKHTYQINYTIAFHICRHFFRSRDMKPQDVEALIQKNILPIRTNRHHPRKVSRRGSVSFVYRVA